MGNLAPEVGNNSPKIFPFYFIYLFMLWFGISLTCENPFCSSAMQVTQLDLHRHFHTFGAGVIEEVRVQRDKGFGFVRYNTHAEAALAIQMGNTQSILCGKPIKV